MCFGGGPSASDQAARAAAAKKAEEARLAEQQRIKDAEALKNTLAQKASQARTEATASAQRQQFFAKGAAQATASTLGGANEDLTNKKTLLANYGK